MATQPGAAPNQDTDAPVEAADMAPLITRVREYLSEHSASLQKHALAVPIPALTGEFGFAAKNQGKPEVILSEDVYAELGHPATASRAMVLTTYDPDLVEHGRISLVGPDLAAMKPGVRGPFAQVVMVALDRQHMPDPFDLENTQYLMHRLPGYMVRSVPGRLWVRVGKKQQAAGLNLHVVGSALAQAFSDDFDGVLKAEVVFITSNNEDVAALEQVAAEAKILSGQHKKLALGVDGSIECSELNCEECDEKPVCDNLRDVVVQRRKLKKGEDK